MQRRAGLWLGCVLVFGLAATALAAKLETIFTISGALFAPVAGVMTAEALLSRGRWTGVRIGWRLPGVLAWSLGVLIGLTPVLGGSTGVGSIQPAALYGYLTAVVVYEAAALLGARAPAVAITRSERPGDAR